MSISEIEAEEMYPRRTWPDRPDILAVLNLTTDDLQEAYMCGREAEPCDEQIEAAAKVLAGWSDPCTDCFEDRCRHIANLMLDAARKAVTE